jgi:hypothetical protein
MESKASKVLILVLAGHALVAAWTWRDIRQQPAGQVRGSKTFWRIASAVNTLGSAGYWLIGRRVGPQRRADHSCVLAVHPPALAGIRPRHQ